jgi:hypothetical protein
VELGTVPGKRDTDTPRQLKPAASQAW